MKELNLFTDEQLLEIFHRKDREARTLEAELSNYTTRFRRKNISLKLTALAREMHDLLKELYCRPGSILERELIG